MLGAPPQQLERVVLGGFEQGVLTVPDGPEPEPLTPPAVAVRSGARPTKSEYAPTAIATSSTTVAMSVLIQDRLEGAVAQPQSACAPVEALPWLEQFAQQGAVDVPTLLVSSIGFFSLFGLRSLRLW